MYVKCTGPNAELSSAIVLKPSDSWGGAGVAGLSIRFHDIASATEHVWHVLEGKFRETLRFILCSLSKQPGQ